MMLQDTWANRDKRPHRRVDKLPFITPNDSRRCTGSKQLYAVPNHSGVDKVTVKLWGAGGGGVVTPGDGFADKTTSNSTRGKRAQDKTYLLVCNFYSIRRLLNGVICLIIARGG